MHEMAARIRPREVALVATDTRLRGLHFERSNPWENLRKMHV